MGGSCAWLARYFRDILRKDVKTLREELNSIKDEKKRVRALEAFGDLCSVLTLEVKKK